MLLIKLYKNCILNETYQNVFSLGKDNNNKTVLEKYLDSLDKSSPITLYNVYYENSGRLVFDDSILENNNTSNIYNYNYMKIVEYNENATVERLTRYCFIDKILCKNGCVYIDYKEDVWSSYGDKIHGITESYFSRTRVKQYTNLTPSLFSLPIKYDGNNKLDISRFEQSDVYKNKVIILLEVQAYDLVQESGANIPKPRIVGNFVYRDVQLTDGEYLGGSYRFTLDEAITRLLNLLSYQGYYFAECGHWSQIYSGVHRFEIGNIFIIPADYSVTLASAGSWNSQHTNFNWTTNSVIRIKETNNLTTFDYVSFLQRLDYSITGMTLKSYSIQNDYKNLFLGTLNSPIKLENNGTTLEVEIKLFVNQSNLVIYLNIANQIIDITESFSYEFPYEGLTSEQMSQRRLSNQMKNLNLNYQKQMNGLTTAQRTISRYSSGVSDFVKGSTEIATFNPAGIGDIVDSLGSIVNAGLEIGKGIATDKKLNEEKTLINSPVYSDNKGIFGNSANFLNYIYGIVLFKINSDNDNYVKKFINNFGYIIYEFINDISLILLEDVTYFETIGANYNVIKFDNINVYGSFPRNIAMQLNEILETGIKIWYNYQMQEDNYVV